MVTGRVIGVGVGVKVGVGLAVGVGVKVGVAVGVGVWVGSDVAVWVAAADSGAVSTGAGLHAVRISRIRGRRTKQMRFISTDFLPDKFIVLSVPSTNSAGLQEFQSEKEAFPWILLVNADGRG